MGNGITNCYPDEVGKFISITVLSLTLTLTLSPLSRPNRERMTLSSSPTRPARGAAWSSAPARLRGAPTWATRRRIASSAVSTRDREFPLHQLPGRRVGPTTSRGAGPSPARRTTARGAALAARMGCGGGREATCRHGSTMQSRGLPHRPRRCRSYLGPAAARAGPPVPSIAMPGTVGRDPSLTPVDAPPATAVR